MRKHFNKRGKFGLALAGLFLLLTVAPGLAQAQAASADVVNALIGVNQTQKYFGTDDNRTLDSGHWVALQGGTSGLDAKQTGVRICPRSSSTPCTSDTDGAITFMLDHVKHYDRKTGGQDSFDFIFTPVVDGQRVNTNLQFRLRQTGHDHRSSGLIAAPAGKAVDGNDLTDLVIARLEGFNESPFAGELEKHANEDGIKWGNVTDSKDTKETVDLGTYLSEGKNDPFAQAVGKVAQALASFTGSLVSALEWAIDVGNLNDINGLVSGWKVVRDLVNVLFVIVLVAIALTTMLRIEPQKYSIRAILPLLIFAVIGVNFSLLMATVMVNTATVASHPFAESAHRLIQAAASGQSFNPNDFGEAIVLLLAALIMVIALAIVLFFFIIRIIVIWLLAVLSPLIFLAMVLPLSRGESKKLIQEWIRWVYLAPISLLILYLGAGVALTPTDISDEGGQAILEAIFYGGVILASIIIPLELGGKLMKLAAHGGRQGGRMGGKAGLGVFGGLPVARGLTLGEATRTGRAFFTQRSDAQKARAAQRAAAAGTQLSQVLPGPLRSSVTGFDETQAVTVQDRLVDEELKRMTSAGVNEQSMLNIVGYKLGRTPESALNSVERGFAESRIGELAAVKGLSQNAWMDKEMLDKYASTGYQQNMAKWDPIIGNVNRNFRGGAIGANDLNLEQLRIQMEHSDGEAMKSVMRGAWLYASDDPAERRRTLDTIGGYAREQWRDILRNNANPIALKQIIDSSHRNAASMPRRRALADIWTAFGPEQQRYMTEGLVKSGGTGFLAPRGGPATYREAKRFEDSLGGGEAPSTE